MLHTFCLSLLINGTYETELDLTDSDSFNYELEARPWRLWAGTSPLWPEVTGLQGGDAAKIFLARI